MHQCSFSVIMWLMGSVTDTSILDFSLETVVPGKAPQDTTVVVAMSGGVDSSVVAALLHHHGYKVIGMTMQLYDHGQAIEKKGACCAGADIYDAKHVAGQLGFPHYILNYEDRFQDSVMEEFADSYLRGETPIPCVRCNQTVKFKDMLSMAKQLGADALATGHYIQRQAGITNNELHRAVDDTKDQSYFLFATTQDQLDYLRFPLGGVSKDTTRQWAEYFKLPVACKPDSQDICFVPNGSYASVVETLRPGASEPGDIIHVDGTVLGSHEGIIHYTIGQRKGLKIAYPEPLYVVKLDVRKKQVIVGPADILGTKRFSLKEVNWLGDGAIPPEGMLCKVKVRSTHAPVDATLFGKGDYSAEIELDIPERAVSPGQACVFYAGERVLGGGWIC